ncbi:cyclase family protein [Natrarchaeobius chitinivorans]|uniref:Cyclase family protein n=1 Tax=Natrarchaeobius chitinivorans TaxID=1679083 RepID=A0A3N6M4K3_NATCH|nr:cyclase family protein [Natrarchaeobius chitinivorans]RQG95424.1 cyclase family protein [Natrarchaeobius chitinivorans]
MTELIDLSGYVEEGQPVYPGGSRTQFWTTSTHEESGHTWKQKAGEETGAVKRKFKARRQGDDEEHPVVRTVLVSEHGPTHIDAMTHLDPTSDESIDEAPLETFYTGAVGVDVSHVDSSDFIEIEDIEGSLEENDLEIRDGDAITLYTGHRDEHYDTESPEKRYDYLYDYTGLSEEAAYWLADEGVKNIGIDAPSIDHSSALETKQYPAHDMGAEREVLNMENMANLDAVAGRRFTLCAFPLKLRDGTGSPIRPVAIIE